MLSYTTLRLISASHNTRPQLTSRLHSLSIVGGLTGYDFGVWGYHVGAERNNDSGVCCDRASATKSYVTSALLYDLNRRTGGKDKAYKLDMLGDVGVVYGQQQLLVLGCEGSVYGGRVRWMRFLIEEGVEDWRRFEEG
ncbi:hypothetical protein Tco_1043472 [Tanacetum coccineum]|uniref:Uncharacterized protein n=1 Tax=Tanacetum coccineum TaxID=301880 RepID=A0ABQ5BPZ2_9ASTR